MIKKLTHTISIVVSLVILMAVNSCGVEPDDKLAFARTTYAGNQLRINGYYYHEYFNVQENLSVYFLYNNGIILDGNSFESRQLREQEKQWLSAEWLSHAKQTKYYWGVFKVEGNSIQFDRWHPSERPLETKLRSGKVLNDTTFVIYDDGREQVYRFRQLSPKPDSTNSFIP